MAYKYRVGESKNLRAKVTPTSDDLPATITSARLRLYGTRDTLIWDKAAMVEGPILKYPLSGIKVAGKYKVQWVYNIAGQEFLSQKFDLTVEA